MLQSIATHPVIESAWQTLGRLIVGVFLVGLFVVVYCLAAFAAGVYVGITSPIPHATGPPPKPAVKARVNSEFSI